MLPLQRSADPIEGGCACRAVRYRLESAPLFVHCCHCRWCQRESGASFALNAMIESDRITGLAADPEIVDTPSESGLGQLVARCGRCRVAVWSHYAGSGPVVAFVRVGTLDRPERLPPDVHIFAASKQPWVVLPDGVPSFDAYYDRESLWPAESLARREALLPAIAAHQATRKSAGSARPVAASTTDVVTPAQVAASLVEHWSPRVVAEFDASYVKVAKVHGTLAWHSHEHEDELFYVLKGSLTIEMEDRAVVLNEGDAFVVPKGVRHNPVAEHECHVMLVERKTTLHTGTEVTAKTRSLAEQLRPLRQP